MAIDLDESSAIRRPSDRVRLVEAVLSAHPSDEAEWIEWKVDVALNEAKGRFQVAKQIIGFANRLPDQAMRFLEGQAFLIVGAEPGRLVGTPPRDPAELEDWVRPYLGDNGPVWDAHHVEFGDKQVLVIEVAPPRDGDPTHTLRKNFENWHEGSVFVRHKGKTEPATSADIANLVSRAAAHVSGKRIAVNLSWARSPATLRALDLGEERVDRLLEAERQRLLRPLDKPRAKSPTQNQRGSLRADAYRAAFRVNEILGWQPEDRDSDEYRNKVESYLANFRKAATAVALSRAVKRPDSLVRVRVQNPSESNFHGVQVVLHAEGDVFAIDPEDNALDERLPTPPRLWGTMRPPSSLLSLHHLSRPMSSYSSPIPRPGPNPLPRMWIENDESARIEFASFDLRPRATEEMDPFVLFAAPSLAGKIVKVSWEATSKSADGVASGSLSIPVNTAPVTLEELLDSPQEEVDGDEDDE